VLRRSSAQAAARREIPAKRQSGPLADPGTPLLRHGNGMRRRRAGVADRPPPRTWRTPRPRAL